MRSSKKNEQNNLNPSMLLITKTHPTLQLLCLLLLLLGKKREFIFNYFLFSSFLSFKFSSSYFPCIHYIPASPSFAVNRMKTDFGTIQLATCQRWGDVISVFCMRTKSFPKGWGIAEHLWILNFMEPGACSGRKEEEEVGRSTGKCGGLTPPLMFSWSKWELSSDVDVEARIWQEERGWVCSRHRAQWAPSTAHPALAALTSPSFGVVQVPRAALMSLLLPGFCITAGRMGSGSTGISAFQPHCPLLNVLDGWKDKTPPAPCTEPSQACRAWAELKPQS